MNENIIIDNIKSTMPNCQFRELNELEVEKIENLISRFDSLSNYSLVVLSDVVEVTNNQNVSFLLLLSITYSYKGIKSPQKEKQIFRI